MESSKAYQEVIDFIASGATPRDVVQFRPSEEARSRVRDLLEREKAGELSADETSELSTYLHLERIMRLAKASARRNLAAQHIAP